MKRTLFLVFLTTIAAAALAAQSLTVSYVEGNAEVKVGQSWQALGIGDSVGGSAVVRLSSQSYLEITGGSQTISLSQAGSYSLDHLLADSREMSSAGVGQALSSRLATLFGEPVQKSTTMGVRAENAADSNGVSWITSDAQVYIDSGKEYIKSRDYKKAIDELKQALDVATGSELSDAHYYLGYAYSLSGDTREALKQVADLKPGDLEASASDLVILKGKLLLDTSAYALDIQWLTSNASVIGSDSSREPVYYLLLGLSYNGAGDTAQARSNLQKVVSLSGDSALGKTAGELLQKM